MNIMKIDIEKNSIGKNQEGYCIKSGNEGLVNKYLYDRQNGNLLVFDIRVGNKIKMLK